MKTSRIRSTPWHVVVRVNVALLFLLVLVAPFRVSANTSTSEKSSSISQSTQAVTDGVTTLQTKISDNLPTNRTRDENVAIVLMGVLVASVAGMFSKVGCTGLGIAGRLALGLGGALIGGIVVRVTDLDFEWGTISIGYEELLFSLLGAMLLVAASRLVQFKMKKKTK